MTHTKEVKNANAEIGRLLREANALVEASRDRKKTQAQVISMRTRAASLREQARNLGAMIPIKQRSHLVFDQRLHRRPIDIGEAVTTKILGELVVAGEAAGWDLNENQHLLQRARDRYAALTQPMPWCERCQCWHHKSGKHIVGALS